MAMLVFLAAWSPVVVEMAPSYPAGILGDLAAVPAYEDACIGAPQAVVVRSHWTRNFGVQCRS